jgi:molybdate transport system regulatory protein
MTIEAHVTLRSESAPAMGRERIRLLQAVAREGSITAGAKAVGLTYKAAWDALDAMSNLFEHPLLEARAGGKAGGGARLTSVGVQVIEAFGRLETEMARVLRLIEPELAGSGITPLNLVSGLLMKTSARNALRGKITSLTPDVLSTEVGVTVSDDVTIYALVTSESVRELGLFVGRSVIALIKAPFVIVSVGRDPPSLTARNCIPGNVARLESSAVTAEVVLDIGNGKSIAATISARGAASLDLALGSPACAIFDAGHVILAID